MSDPNMQELLWRRLDIVARLSQATSQLQKRRQVRMAAEMDVLRCEMSGDDTAQELRRERRESSTRAEEAESDVAQCEALIAAMEESLAETDREIEALAAH